MRSPRSLSAVTPVLSRLEMQHTPFQAHFPSKTEGGRGRPARTRQFPSFRHTRGKGRGNAPLRKLRILRIWP